MDRQLLVEQQRSTDSAQTRSFHNDSGKPIMSCKMPQRPGSSKPMQKGGLLDDDKPSSTTAASVGKRPESPVNKSKKTKVKG